MRTIRQLFIHYLVFILFNIYHNVQTLSIRNSPKTSLQICDKFFYATNCYYFSCIDSIYQCGQGNLLVQFSYRLCEATLEQTYKSLTRAGQSWAKAAQTCLMQELHYFLETSPSLSCTEIDRHILKQYPICLTQSHPKLSLCSIICNNLEVFFDIFQNWDIQSINLKRLLLETSHLCQEQSQMEYVIDIEQSTIRMIFWSLCLDSLKTKFENFHPNEVMISNNQNPGIFADIIDKEN